MSFSRIRDLQVFHVYATCEFLAYTSLVSFSRMRDLRVFHVYVTCEFFTYTRLASFSRIRHMGGIYRWKVKVTEIYLQPS